MTSILKKVWVNLIEIPNLNLFFFLITNPHSHIHFTELTDQLTLFNLPSADIKSAHSLEYSKFFRALSIFDMYTRYLGCFMRSYSSIRPEPVAVSIFFSCNSTKNKQHHIIVDFSQFHI